MAKRIAIGGDHAGVGYKEQLKQHLGTLGYSVQDFGPFSTDSVDYPDYVHPLSLAIEAGEVDFGIVICGSGNGVAITANKHQGIRAALCWNEELAACLDSTTMQMYSPSLLDLFPMSWPKRWLNSF